MVMEILCLAYKRDKFSCLQDTKRNNKISPSLVLTPYQYIYLVVNGCNRKHHGQTKHPTEKFIFNEFVQKSLCCDMGINIFDLHDDGGC